MVSVSRDLREREPGVRGASSVSEERRQGKKGNTATEYCNMAAVGFLSQTAVPLTKRSSSHPRGVRLVSPNLSAALLYLATSGWPRLHIAPIVGSVHMPCSSYVLMMKSVFQTSPPCIYFHLNIRIPLH